MRIAVFLFCVSSALGQTIVSTTANTLAATVKVVVSNPSACTVRASYSRSLTPLHPSVDPAVVAGINVATHARHVIGTQVPSVTFVIGDGRLVNGVSLALGANKTIYGSVDNCGSGSVPFVIHTPTVPSGTTSGSVQPAGVLAVDWTDKTKKYIDPQTGVEWERISGPGLDGVVTRANRSPSAAAGAGWTNAANAVAEDGSTATISGSSAALFLAWDQANDALGAPSWGDAQQWDYLQAHVRASGTGTGEDAKLEACWTYNRGASCASAVKELAVSASLTTQTIGTTTAIDHWQGASYPPKYVFRALAGKRSGNASYVASTRTLTNNGSYNTSTNLQNAFAREWAGGRINVGGTYYTIESVPDRATIILVSGPASDVPLSGGFGVNWTVDDNFGLLVRKKTASANTLAVDSVRWSYQLSGGRSWYAGGALIGTGTTSTNSAGKVGRNIAFGSDWYWLAEDGSELMYAGKVMIPGYGGQECVSPGMFVDPRNPDTVFCADPSNGSIHKGVYQVVNGGAKYTAPGAQWGAGSLGIPYLGAPYIPATCTGLNAGYSGGCIVWTELFDAKKVQTLVAEFNPGINTDYPAGIGYSCAYTSSYGAGWAGTHLWSETNTLHVVWHCGATIQNGGHHIYVIDLGNELPNSNPASTIQVIAGRDTWSGKGCRWCGNHGGGAGVLPGTVNIVGHPMNAPWAEYDYNHMGPFWTQVTAGTMTSTPSSCAAFASNPYLPAAGTAGGSCDTVTVQGEFCDDSPGNIGKAKVNAAEATHYAKCGRNSVFSGWTGRSAYWLQDAILGDYAMICSSALATCEVGRLIAVNGNQRTFYRGPQLHGDPYSPAKNTTGPRNHSGTIKIYAHCNLYDFESRDNGAYLLWDYMAVPQPTPAADGQYIAKGLADGHGFFTDSAHGVSGVSCGIGTTCYGIREGVLPERMGAAAPQYHRIVTIAPPFGGLAGGGVPNSVDTHPAYVGGMVYDGRPMNGGFTGTFSLVSGSLYKATNVTLDRKRYATIAYSGTTQLTDVSVSTIGNAIGTTSTDYYKYCVAARDGECRVGSTAGDVYVNVPKPDQLTSADVCCGNDSYVPVEEVRDISVLNAYAHLQTYTETVAPASGSDLYGAGMRVLGSAFQRYRSQNTFMAPGISRDGKRLIVQTRMFGGLRSELLMTTIPSRTDDTVQRYDWLPFKVTGKKRSSLVRVKFGYNSSFHCSSRVEACYAVGAAVNREAPFKFEYEAPGAGVSADPYEIMVPARSLNVLYYRVQHVDGTGAIVSEGDTEALALQ